MISNTFDIKEHILDAQHIREYPRALGNLQEDILKLAIKQYTPKDNPNPSPGDVTIIGAHANGYPKELYEPFWIELHARSKANGFRIRSIWISDVAHQGQSGVLNENVLGNDPSWLDHSRDLLHMINHFKTEMPMPLVGIGHSLGGAQLVNLALMHPRLLRTLVLMDPVIEAIKSPSKEDAEARMTGTIPAHASTFRRDIWPSRAEAEASFLKQKYYQAWDKRVLAAWLEYGLRETPTAIYPQDNGSVTLTCTKHQEVFTFLRPILTKNEKAVDYPDGMEGCLNSVPPMHFYRPEPPMLMSRMPNLRPSTLFIFGEISPMSTPGLQQHKMAITGTGEGGSGGEKEGRVKKAVLKDIGHLVAMEAVDLCADAAAPWLGQELRIWQNELKVYQDWSKQAKLDKIMVSEEWKSKMGGPPRRGNTKAKI